MTSQPNPAPEDDNQTVIPIGDTHELRVERLPFTLVIPDEWAELMHIGTPKTGKSRQPGRDAGQ